MGSGEDAKRLRCAEFQRFLMVLSVRPGRRFAISTHEFPSSCRAAPRSAAAWTQARWHPTRPGSKRVCSKHACTEHLDLDKNCLDLDKDCLDLDKN